MREGLVHGQHLGFEQIRGRQKAARRLQVRWHRSLDEVPTDAPAVFIAHEFFDALPVHQFEHTDRGWCERLVDLAPPASPLHLQMVLSPGPTPASKLLVPRRLAALPPGQSEATLWRDALKKGIVDF